MPQAVTESGCQAPGIGSGNMSQNCLVRKAAFQCVYDASRLEVERLDEGLDTVTWLELVAVINFCQNPRANLVSYAQPI